MNSAAIKRRTVAAIWALALGPLLLPALFMAAALHLRIQLGHWAVPMIDNYNGHGMVFLLIIVLVLAPGIPFWWMVLFAPLAMVSLRQRCFQIATYFACWALFALYCRIDPWSYIEWLRD